MQLIPTKVRKIFKRFKFKSRKGYEGAGRSKRTSNWLTGSGDANSSIRAGLPTLRSRSRDLRRNNPIAKRAIEVTTSNVVGKGIKTRITGTSADALQLKWDKWAGSPKCDYDGRHNLAGIQRLAMDAIQESGEVLIRRRFVNDSEFPIQYQILESDYLDNSMIDGKLENGNILIQGIEFDSNGRRVAYHLYENHPGSITASLKLNTVRVLAKDVIHLFRQDRPGQVRGVPWLSAVMIRLKDLDDYQDAQLMRQKIAAMFTAFVHDISADVECADDDEGNFGEDLEPGIIEELPPGKTITFANPPSVENYQEFTSVELRTIAAGYGLSYAALTGDLSNANFSAGRMGHLEMNRNIESWREMFMIYGLLSSASKDFLDMMELTGEMYSDDTSFKHIPPRREMIDPTKEIPATIKAIRAGLTSTTDEIAAMGKDPEAVFEQLAKDQQKTEELGLILDSNPKYTTFNGKYQDGEVDDSEDDTTEDAE